MKNFLFCSLLLSCISITILSNDESSTCSSFEKFKQQCPATIAIGQSKITIDKSTLKYVGPHTKETCKNICCNLWNLPGQYISCDASTTTPLFKKKRRITYDEETLKIVEIAELSKDTYVSQ
jgi:hypothetical protein